MRNRKSRKTSAVKGIARKIIRAKKNKKVRNATPNTYDGINFKSKLETNCYKIFQDKGITLKYEPTRFTLLEGFEYNGYKFRDITYTPDFIDEERGIIIETKGFATNDFKLRWKLFLWYLKKTNSHYRVYILKNIKQIRECLEEVTSNNAQ